MSVLATDNFNRADENPATGWTTLTSASGVKVVSNTVTSLGTGEVAAYYTSVTPPNDQYAKMVINALGTGSGAGPAVRLQTGSLGGYLVSSYGAGANGMYITRDDNTLIGSALTSEAHASGDTYQLNIVGTTLTSLHNGVSKNTGTDATYAGGRFGLWWWENTTAGTTFGDTWEGGDFTSLAGYVLQEDGTSKIQLEDASGFLITEETVVGGPPLFLPECFQFPSYMGVM